MLFQRRYAAFIVGFTPWVLMRDKTAYIVHNNRMADIDSHYVLLGLKVMIGAATREGIYC